MNQTATTRRANLDLQEAIERSVRPITVIWIDDDGFGHDRQFANMAAADEFERKCWKQKVMCHRLTWIDG
jgi:hypothetical protein